MFTLFTVTVTLFALTYGLAHGADRVIRDSRAIGGITPVSLCLCFMAMMFGLAGFFCLIQMVVRVVS